LGGHVPQEENPNEALFVEEWPSWVHHSPEREPDRALPKPISARWLISMQYVRDIQSQDWWDSPPRRLINDRILWPQKTYGLSAKYEGTKFDHDWASSDEGRAYLLGQGLLVVEREQGFSTVAAKESLSGRWKGLFKKLIL